MNSKFYSLYFKDKITSFNKEPIHLYNFEFDPPVQAFIMI
jgi:hypothetical protein